MSTTPRPSPYRFDGSQLAAEYGATRSRIRSLLSGISDSTAATTVPSCPDWSVVDLCAHLAGVCADLAAQRGPTGDTQAWVDAQVSDRRGRTVDSLLDEWDTAGPAFEKLIEARPGSMGGLLYDIVAHEHDARGALGMPGERSTIGVLASVDIMRAMLDRDLAAHGLGGVRLATPRHEWVAGTGEVELTLRLDGDDAEWELMRMIGSRRTLDQVLGAPWQGDVARFLPGLAHLPLPRNDLSE